MLLNSAKATSRLSICYYARETVLFAITAAAQHFDASRQASAVLQVVQISRIKTLNSILKRAAQHTHAISYVNHARVAQFTSFCCSEANCVDRVESKGRGQVVNPPRPVLASCLGSLAEHLLLDIPTPAWRALEKRRPSWVSRS